MHEPYIRTVPGANTAVLYLHGIIGTPEHFRMLMPLEKMAPENWSVHNLLLPGHGGTAEDFGRSSMSAWKSHAEQAFLELAATHQQVFLCAHSMGTLLALDLALKYPEKIPQLFLLAVPMRPGLRLFGLRNMLRVAFDQVRPDRPVEVATFQACGIRTTRKVWKYLSWIPRYLELFREIHRIETKLAALQVTAIAFQSRIDELVSNRSRRVLEKFPQIEIRDLENSSHFYYDPRDRETVVRTFCELCRKLQTMEKELSD